MVDISAGFKTNLATISGLHAYDGWADSVQAPAAFPILQSTAPLVMDRSTQQWTFDLYIVVQLSNFKHAQAAMEPYLASSGASSIEAALLADPTLNGSAQDILDIRLTTYNTIALGNVEYLGAIYRVEVMA